MQNLLRKTSMLAAFALLTAVTTMAGNFNGFRQSVGGVSVDANGVVSSTQTDTLQQLRKLRTEAMKEINRDLDQKVEMRKISLARLSAVIKEFTDKGADLPDEVEYLAGLQRITHVLVYPDRNDIVLAGPAEGWKVNEQGEVVGKTTGLPVLRLQDLLVAMHHAKGNITCSIDPTQEGIVRLQQFLAKQGGKIGPNAEGTVKSIEQVLGPQDITFTGVTPNTRLANVLVAADYRMKRIAMGFEKSPTPKVKSFLAMTSGTGDMFPRWWLTTNYNPLLKSDDGLAWEISGPGVKAMTEDAFFTATGARQTTGKVNPIAQKWADDMTNNYDAMAKNVTIFNELRNVMDMAVVVALIQKENLLNKAKMEMTDLLSPTVPLDKYNVPKTVPTQASFIKKGRNYVISASGGIDINPSRVVERTSTKKELENIRMQSAADATIWQWWWN